MHTRHLRSCVIALALTAGGAQAAAQQPGPSQDPAAAARERAVEQCRRMSSAELQIACLEAALEAAYRVRTAPGSSPAPNRPVSTSGLGAEQVARRESQAATAAASEAQNGPGLLSRLNPFSRSDGSGTVDAAASSAPSPSVSGLGSEQVERRERRASRESGPAAASMAARIIDADIHGYASLVFALDNGQVWRQLSADTQRLDADDVVGARVIVSEGRISGYQAEITDIGRTIRVERIR